MDARIIGAYGGLGDCVTQRPLIAELCRRHERIYFHCPWPEVFSDLPGCRFLHPALPVAADEPPRDWCRWTHFQEHLDAQPYQLWADPAEAQGAEIYRWDNDGHAFAPGETRPRLTTVCPEIALPAAIHDLLPVSPAALYEARSLIGRGRLRVLLHVPTADPRAAPLARDPDPTILPRICAELLALGAAVYDARYVSPWQAPTATLPDLRVIDTRRRLPLLVAAVAAADLVITGDCHLVPLSAALGRPLFFLRGHGPRLDRLLDPRLSPPLVRIHEPPGPDKALDAAAALADVRSTAAALCA